MSMKLHCVYEEEFESKIVPGKTLKYRDELRIFPEVRDPYCWTIMFWDYDAKDYWENIYGKPKTNEEIYKHLLHFLSTNFSEVMNKEFLTYSQQDNIDLMNGSKTEDMVVPISRQTQMDIFQEAHEEFFAKYGGIDNVKWEVW